MSTGGFASSRDEQPDLHVPAAAAQPGDASRRTCSRGRARRCRRCDAAAGQLADRVGRSAAATLCSAPSVAGQVERRVADVDRDDLARRARPRSSPRPARPRRSRAPRPSRRASPGPARRRRGRPSRTGSRARQRSPSRSSSGSGTTFTSACRTATNSANEPSCVKPGWVWFGHTCASPARHCSHVPQPQTNGTVTRSPTVDRCARPHRPRRPRRRTRDRGRAAA